MKKIVWIVVFVLTAWTARAQQAAFVELFDRHLDREGFTCVELGRKMMEMMSRQTASEDKKLARLLGGIVSIRILVSDQPDPEFIAEALAVAAAPPYQRISLHSEQGQSTHFYLIDGGTERRSEFLMVSWGDQETVVVDVYGVFEVAEVPRLATLRPQ